MNHPYALASLLLLGYTASYVLMCSIFPFGACRRCHGTGRRHSRLIRSMFRECRRCAGTGRRVRLGRRIYEYIAVEYRNGTRPERGQIRTRRPR